MRRLAAWRATIAPIAEINGYRFGHVVIDGSEQTRDVIVLPERVVPNWLAYGRAPARA
jgi:hypothetical protein